MISINEKNCYITQKIDEKLKKVEICLIDKTWLIEYNCLKLHVRIYKLINNKKEINL